LIHSVEISPEELAALTKVKGATERQGDYDALIVALAISGKGAKLSELGISPRGVALSLHHAARRAGIVGLNTQVLVDGCYASVRSPEAASGPEASKGKGK